MYKGKLNIIYIGDDTGDMNLPVDSVSTPAILESIDSKSVKLTTTLSIGGLTEQLAVAITIKDYAAYTDPIRLFIDDVIKIDKDDYVLTALMLFDTDNGIEQFRVIGRFCEGIPEGIHFHESPMKNL